MKIIFATNNPHKVEEACQILGPDYEIVTPSQLGLEGDIPETHPTIAGNSLQKAQYIWDRFHKPCFADDTGLEVDALGGAPGVYSARYAGEGKNPADNRAKLLGELEGLPFEKRTAHFTCVVTYIDARGEATAFEGRCEGHIALEESPGVQGFGYDKIFIAQEYNVPMAEMTMEQKSAVSHRGKAMRAFRCHLQKNQG